jgi:hypothetical protein
MLSTEFQFIWPSGLDKWTETWWEAHMEGIVLSFLKAEWKVSDTSSTQWASSFGFPFKVKQNVAISTSLVVSLVESTTFEA